MTVAHHWKKKKIEACRKNWGGGRGREGHVNTTIHTQTKTSELTQSAAIDQNYKNSYAFLNESSSGFINYKK